MVFLCVQLHDGRVLAEWSLECDILRANRDSGFDIETMAHGENARFTVILPPGFIPLTTIVSRYDGNTAYVEDNWAAYEQLFIDIERLTSSPDK